MTHSLCQLVVPVVGVVISSLTVAEVTIRVIWVGRMVSSDGPGENIWHLFKLNCKI